MMAIGPPLGVHPGAQIKGIAVWRSARVFAPCMLAVRVRVSLSPLLLFLRPPRPSERVVATLDLSALLCSAAVATPVACARKLFLPRASVPFRSPVVASPPRRPGPPARPAPHVAHQPDPNAATATRGAVGSRSRSVAACPQYTTTANKARPKPTDGSRRRRRGRARGTGGISLWGHPRGTRELVGSIDIGTVLAGDADRAAGT